MSLLFYYSASGTRARSNLRTQTAEIVYWLLNGCIGSFESFHLFGSVNFETIARLMDYLSMLGTIWRVSFRFRLKLFRTSEGPGDLQTLKLGHQWLLTGHYSKFEFQTLNTKHYQHLRSDIHDRKWMRFEHKNQKPRLQAITSDHSARPLSFPFKVVVWLSVVVCETIKAFQTENSSFHTAEIWLEIWIETF